MTDSKTMDELRRKYYEKMEEFCGDSTMDFEGMIKQLNAAIHESYRLSQTNLLSAQAEERAAAFTKIPLRPRTP